MPGMLSGDQTKSGAFLQVDESLFLRMKHNTHSGNTPGIDGENGHRLNLAMVSFE